jgi:hypothetical protein
MASKPREEQEEKYFKGVPTKPTKVSVRSATVHAGEQDKNF